MAVKIRPYKLGSRGANLLRDHLQQLIGGRVLLSRNSAAFMGRRVVSINWGSDEALPGRTIGNAPQAVAQCRDKRLTFNALKELAVENTTKREDAENWLKEGHSVYCRRTATGQEGAGIVIADHLHELVDSPLYTKRFRHTREYRVHVAYGKVIQIVQKRKRADAGENVDPRIRSNANWVFARKLDAAENSDELRLVKEAALEGARRIGVAFGAFDILWSVKNNKAAILECNSAPGLDDTSARCYAEAFQRELMRQQ